ncbi:MAG TPA: GFA family protein [Sphingomonas sp.]|nr:GFA family protein [Sphingomonas sp.]
MAHTVTGGCQCGRIRYSVVIDDDDAYLCHCRMCQRATGGVSIALKGVTRANLTWTTREPDRYASSPIANRGFCSACGTPLTFEFSDDESLAMDLTVGSFDDPYRFRPASHFAVESCNRSWLDTRGLPGKRSEDNPSTRDRWMKAIGRLPD